MNKGTFSFQAKVWIYQGMGAWYFVTLPSDRSEVIKELYGWGKRGFGSIRAEVTIGNTQWKTSIFPDSKSNSYILPLKAFVRKQEGINNHDTVSVKISLLV